MAKKKAESKEIKDNEIVVMVGVKNSGFDMSHKKEYKVMGSIAKILIKTGRAELK
jgi:hypothetical protein